MQKLLEINKLKKINLKVVSLILFNLSIILCYGQSQKQLVFGIDTSFHNEQENDIVRYQIYIQDGIEVNSLFQIDQVKEDFTYLGNLLIDDSSVYIFVDYSSPAAFINYYYIVQSQGKILTVKTNETETLLVGTLNIPSMDIYCIDFNTECGLLMKKNVSLIERQLFAINHESFLEIINLSIPK